MKETNNRRKNKQSKLKSQSYPKVLTKMFWFLQMSI